MKFFTWRGFLIFLGLLFLALFIWFAGPYFAFAEFRPLESAIARLIAILVVVAIWALWLLLKHLRARRASAKLAEAVVAQSAPPAAGASREAMQLRERFEEAIATLKKTQTGGHSLYDLPWYVIIGPPGSGKTTALINSGLRFPLEQRFGKEPVGGVGGTRNCDWFFTDDAVLLDTAGRFTTQDSDAAADSAAWGEFLTLLTKYRKRRPLNGVIVTLNAEELMRQTSTEREDNVAKVRRRLDELNRHLKVRLPVYVMVTKCDLVSGFGEYFDDLGAEGRAQVWGMTFAPERSLSGTAAEDFAGEFDALIERLNQRLFGRIEEERDPRRRTAVFAFPQQTAGIRNLIGAFVTEVFSATRFDGRLLLRGVYFTSGTQEGTPIDRLMAAIGRGFALAPDVVPASAAGRGKAYFIEKLLREVLFAEAGLAGVNRQREWQKAALQLGAYAAMLLIAVLGVIVLSVSYARNKSYLADVSSALDQLNSVPLPEAQQTLPQMVPGLDALRNVVDVAERYRNHLALSLHWGLYQGSAVADEARDAYQRELNGSLLPQIADEFKRRLQASAAHPDVVYQYLKAYLMLGEPEHLDKNQLAFLVGLEWQDAFASQPDVLQSLTAHLRSLIEDQDRLRALPLDDALVAQSRNTIRQASLPVLMYDQLRLSHVDDTSHDLRLDIAAGIGAERVLSRKSAKLSDPVPGLYTRAVFDQISVEGTAGIVKQFAEDHWVMADSAFDMKSAMGMGSQVMEVYADDYIKTWDGIIKDVQVVPLRSVDQTGEVLGLVAGSTSPLKGFLTTVEANTNMTKPAAGGAAAAGAASAAESAVLNPLKKLLGGGNKPAPGAVSPAERITVHFATFNQAVAGPPGGAHIDRIIALVAQVQQKLAGGGKLSGSDESVKALSLEASTLPPAIGGLVTQLLGGTETTVGRDRLQDFLGRYQDEIVKQCNQIITGHYPFVLSSPNDVPLADFGRLFASGGIFDKFFSSTLAADVDTSRSAWAWKDSSATKSMAILRQFEAAQQIRDNYLGAGQIPDQQFGMTPGELDAGATRFTLELDGQTLDYRHGPVTSIQVHWPGPSSGTAAATFEDASGAHPNLVFHGPWAWFRLLDTATVREESDSKFDVTFQSGGHQATVVITPRSILNPFQKSLRQFNCGG
jgi:type VI secretion system protein ImpL